MKECISCGVELSAANTTWYRLKNYIYKCNECMRDEKRAQAERFRDRNPKIVAERSRKHHQRLKNNDPVRYTARQQYSSAYKRAKALDLPFDLTTEDIENISTEHCPILGCKLKYGGGEKTNESASLDRIDSSIGYIKGNIQIISYLANLMKSNASKEDLIKFADWVYDTFFVKK